MEKFNFKKPEKPDQQLTINFEDNKRDQPVDNKNEETPVAVDKEKDILDQLYEDRENPGEELYGRFNKPFKNIKNKEQPIIKKKGSSKPSDKRLDRPFDYDR